MVERAITFACQGEQLVGILSLPTTTARVGALIVVGGPQYRAGSHRQFVILARALAAQGIAAMRFDVRGMGDAEGEQRTFENINSDIDAAVQTLTSSVPTLKRVVLVGLCDGASACLLHAHQGRVDPKITGLVLLNPWVRSAQTLAKAQVSHYYAQRLRDRAFWAKLLRGAVSFRAPLEFMRKVGQARSGDTKNGASDASTFQQRMAQAWARWPGHIWLVLSGKDLTAAEFLQSWSGGSIWAAARARPGFRRLDLPDADHTLSSVNAQNDFARWLGSELAGIETAIGQRPAQVA